MLGHPLNIQEARRMLLSGSFRVHLVQGKQAQPIIIIIIMLNIMTMRMKRLHECSFEVVDEDIFHSSDTAARNACGLVPLSNIAARLGDETVHHFQETSINPSCLLPIK